MEIDKEQKKRITKWILGIATAIILIFLGVQNISHVANAFNYAVGLLMPLLLGVVIAVILNVPMRFFEMQLFKITKNKDLQKLGRPLAFLLSLVLIVGIIAGIIRLVIPELASAVSIIVDGAIDAINKLSSMSQEELMELPFGNILLNTDWNNILSNVEQWLKTEGGSMVNAAFGTVTSLIGGIFDFFISFVFAIYILFSKDELKKQATRLIQVWVPKRYGEWFIHAVSVANVNFRNFISGQSLEAVILGVLCMVGMWIFRFPYAPMVGALVGVTALIPVVGAFIGAGVGAFMILTVDPLKTVFFLLFIVVLQQLEGNVIYPKVMGSRVNLPGMWILAAVTIGGGIGGPVGMLVSVPIASTAYALFKEATDNRERRQAVNNS